MGGFFCDPERIQTFNLLIRSQVLYSIELRGRLFKTLMLMQKREQI